MYRVLSSLIKRTVLCLEPGRFHEDGTLHVSFIRFDLTSHDGIGAHSQKRNQAFTSSEENRRSI